MAMSLERIVKERITLCGAITFAQFMEMALYHVPGGYYTAGADRIGPQGDFYTSPLAHPAFGALVAIQLEQMWQNLGSLSAFWVVEMGSGKGALGRDIQDYARNLSPGFSDALRYLSIERSRQAPQVKSDSLISQGLPLHKVKGCILSNELLDAMPVHRVVNRQGRLMEIYVGLDGEKLAETMDEPSTTRLQQRLDSLGASLAEGQEAEVNLLMEDWLRQVSEAIDEGYVITIDYGSRASELYSPARSRGTLTCHFKHTANRRPLTRIGEQDLTAHVDFTSFLALGEKEGLRACGLVSQAQFLVSLGIRSFIDRLGTMSLGSGEYHSNLMGLRSLIDPQGLGGFQVAIQRKGRVPDRAYGLEREVKGVWGAMADRRELSVPLLSSHHIDLLRGKYPHLAWSPEDCG